MIDTKGGASAAKASGGTAKRKNGASRRMANSASRPTSPEKRATPTKAEKHGMPDRKSRRGSALAFEPDRLVDYGNAALLDELRRVAQRLPDGALTTTRFDRQARVSSYLVSARFGGWRAALGRAGLIERHISRSSLAYFCMDRTRRMTKKAIAAELRAMARRHEGRLRACDVADSETLSLDVIRNRFGQWSSALKAAGLRSEASGRRYGNAELYANLLRMWKHCGRPPRQTEMLHPPSRITPSPYCRRFGTWSRTIAAFAAHASSGGAPADFAPSPATRARAPGGGAPRKRCVARALRRDLSAGLRYRILLRDDFRCTQCGDSPAITRGCALQIDHIVPFSKGGRTEPGNLRTLCRRCNVGRGAKGGR